jgi:hypothetical protein
VPFPGQDLIDLGRTKTARLRLSLGNMCENLAAWEFAPDRTGLDLWLRAPLFLAWR